MKISKNKLITSAALVGLLGILITIFSVYHAKHMGNYYLEYPLFLYGTTIIALIVGGFIVYLFEQKINDSQLDRVLAILPPNEKKILKVLIERNEIEQNKLGTLSGISKVKLSRLLSTLEQRGVVEKKKQGYTNLIVLKI